MLKKLCVSMLLTAALCGGVYAQSPVARNGKLSVKNGKIVNKDGDPVALRGMSFFWTTNGWGGEKFYTAGAVNTLASDWKVDIVRAAMDPGSRGAWETVVTAAIDKGIYVIIDWHSHNAHNEESAAKTFFETQAEKYKNTPNVIFEIYNEPDTKDNPCTWSQVRTYANNVVKAIRDKGSDNIIIIGSRDYSKRVDEAADAPVTGTNLAYAVHYYTAEPGGQHQADLRNWCTYAISKGLALFVSEFGISEADGGQQNTTKIDTVEAKTWFNYLDRNSIGWANWSIHEKGEAASALTSGASGSGGWSDGNLSTSGKFIKGKLVEYGTKTWTVTVASSANGKVTSSPPGPTYRHGTMVTLTAEANEGFVFSKWQGADGSDLGTRNPATFSSPLYSNKSVEAVFSAGTGLIKNGTFTNNNQNWLGTGTNPSPPPRDATEDALKITVSSNTSNVRQTGLNLTQNKKYAVSFRAKLASGNVTVKPGIYNSLGVDGTAYWAGDAVQLTTAWRTVTGEFCMNANDADARIVFQSINSNGGVWFLDDVMLNEAGACQGAAVLPSRAIARSAAWSVARIGGGLQLRGPAEAGARVSLYDVRGKMVRSAAAADGMALGAGIPAGSYIVVVKNRAGGEVLRTKVVMTR